MKIKFAIIADLHFGPAKYDTPEHLAVESSLPDIVASAVAEINKIDGIEFVINLGDLVQERTSNPSREEDLANADRVLKILKNLKRPLYHVVGNHDRITLSFDDLRKVFGHSLYYTFESENYTNIVLQCESPGHFDVHLVEGEQEWLEQQLKKSSKPVIIYMHQLLVEQPLEGTSCEGIPGCAYLRNKEEIRALLENSGKVKAVINGHMHFNLFKVHNQIPYITIQALTQPIPSTAHTTEAYAIVEIDTDGLSVSVKGRDPTYFSYQW